MQELEETELSDSEDSSDEDCKITKSIQEKRFIGINFIFRYLNRAVGSRGSATRYGGTKDIKDQQEFTKMRFRT